MPPQYLSELCRQWREGLFSDLEWTKDPANPLLPGEAGGYRVRAEGFSYGGYLKPVQKCGEHHRRAANEKIVADLAHDLGFNVPPVLLIQRTDALLGEETNCCVSLIIYPEQYEWGILWDLSIYPPFVGVIVKEALSRYSASYALDLWIGQTDRNNIRNVIILGVAHTNPVRTEFLFLDHSNSLNMGNRWDGGGGNRIEMVASTGHAGLPIWKTQE